MARLTGASDYLTFSATIGAQSIFSIAFFGYVDSWVDASAFISPSNDSTGLTFGVQVSGAATLNPRRKNTVLGFSAPTAGVWHHYAGVFDTNSAGVWWVDGVRQTLTRNDGNPGGTYSDVTLYLQRFKAFNKSLVGRMAEFAMWSGYAFSDGDVLALAHGVSPLAIRLDRLFAYAPLEGVNPEPIINRSGYYPAPLVLNGAPTGTASPFGMVGPPRPRLDPILNALGGGRANYRTLLGVGT